MTEEKLMTFRQNDEKKITMEPWMTEENLIVSWQNDEKMSTIEAWTTRDWFRVLALFLQLTIQNVCLDQIDALPLPLSVL